MSRKAIEEIMDRKLEGIKEVLSGGIIETVQDKSDLVEIEKRLTSLETKFTKLSTKLNALIKKLKG